MPEFGTYYGLLAVYCEVRHASGDDRAVEGTPRGSRDGRPPAGVRVGGGTVR
jgi:hypothetical protein